ncbi:SusC/RagA family TonB-linked outer membrane protein [Flavobacterium johnsoniae]|uniref:SusC/RagA family TonB-linked outer membrane protein n=1 Tax=Flavobacterium johnsoniae TaxID=986 RepID=UPI0015BB130D|nr:SusC/RagA family TonB-linked outer membrane protein [Flavobacterium johnsoniae]NWL02873.1 SusC/RagA family TonB-linked outer membrane protein [Flavobacterium collinsii]WJS94487.1 SusC/RagA family TonB-linked outer membrane protein [Flavobacterium johnsoniae]
MNYSSFYKDGKAVYCLFFAGIILSFSSSMAANSKRLFSAFSQHLQVQGTVTDGTAPLPGVTVSVRGRTSNAAITDYNGQYSISVSPTDTLSVSFIGFKTRLIPVKGRSKIDITLEYDTTTLQEVRVNAGYYSVKESERTGSIARITSKDIETQPVTNVLAAMQGRMAGVSITQTTGVPGGAFDIKVRGQNSIRSDANAPLYIIDGVPYSSDPIGYSQTSTPFPSLTSPLNSIDPASIESIEVLKDADATSIYGSRGANGVVLITTKKGRKGKTTFSFNASTGASSVTRFAELMDTEQYLNMRRQAFANDGITSYPASAFDVNGTWDQNRYTDWQKTLTGRTALTTILNASVQGGSERTQFRLSGGSSQQSTVFPEEFTYKKSGVQLSVTHTSADDRFRLSVNTGYNLQNNNQPAFDFTYTAKFLAPNAPALYDENGKLNWAGNTWLNPLRNLEAKFKSKTRDLITGAVVSYDISKGFQLKANLGYSDLNHMETRINPSTIYNPVANVTSASSTLFVNNTQRTSWIVEPQINFDREFAGSKLSVILGSTFQDQTTTSLAQSGTGFSSNSLIYNMASASTSRTLFSEKPQYRYQAFFGRINYTIEEKYILNLTARRDGSSRFGPENQFANFGAIGAAWLFSKEKFMINNQWLSFGKLRASYGTTGSDKIGDYQYLDTYTTTGVLYDGNVGLQPSRLFNPDFGWEVNKKLEAALEIGFLHDRIFLTAAWYQNRSSNQLVGIPLASTTGFSTLQANLDALVQNNGLEFTLRTENITGKTFSWATNFNISTNKNKLLEFPNLQGSSYSQTYRIGLPLNIRLLYQFEGVDPQTGLYKFSDLNLDGKITSPEDKQIAMDLTPKYYGGLQNQLSYKAWKLDFLFQFVKQKNTIASLDPAGQMSNMPVRFVDSWTNPGDQTPYQIYTAGYNNGAVNNGYLYNSSTAFVTDASFIRLKNIALSWLIPLQLKNVQCSLNVQAENLLTFTNYQDGDPEFISSGNLSPLKTITGGIQFNF